MQKESLSIITPGWKAAIAATGGNLFRLEYRNANLKVLRQPASLRELAASPAVYGIPLLFLPNRIEDGCFTLDSREYRFPINETAKNNHLHGFMHKKKWQLSKSSDKLAASYHHTDLEIWPFEFKVNVEYLFTSDRMMQTIKFHNLSQERMPFFFGQHTAFRLPDTAEVDVSAGRRINLSGRNLPDGTYSDYKTVFNSKSDPVDMLVENSGFYARINHPGIQITYKVDPQYKFWVLWNWDHRHRIFCIEPQTCTINPVKAAALLKDTGIRFIDPHQENTLQTEIVIKER